MKKQLLLGTALLAAFGAFSQNSRISGGGIAGPLEIKKAKLSATAGVNEAPISPMAGSGLIKTSTPAGKPAPTQINWQLLTGSMNTYGMLVNQSRPLQYNPDLNVTSFIHRKSDHYVETPALPQAAESGVIVAQISSDWGTTWDSTCIWSDANEWGRYPQGGVYNPVGNTSLANAYVVGSGPTVSGSNFTGNWYASKQLNAFNSTASTAPGAMQFLSFTLSSYPPDQLPHGWSRCGFSSTRDGIVRSLGVKENDLTGLSTMRGYAVVTGTFNGTAFDWKVDSLIPNTTLDAAGDKNLNPDGQMAWNQDGTIGYVVGIGSLPSGTMASNGMQPIIWKMDRTTNPAATWTLMSKIDFNDPSFRPVVVSRMNNQIGMAGLYTVTSVNPPGSVDTIGAPFFNDFDVAVDANGKVHIAATFYSHFTDNPDSLNFLVTYTTDINPTERYSWRHLNGSRPYLYDFYGDGNSYSWKLIDSISSEGPSAASGQRGFNENPWDPTGDNGSKLNIEARLQIGRSPDGKLIYYSWTESDTSFTNNFFKWNNLPNIKTRAMAVHSGTNTNAYLVDLGPEQNMTANDVNVNSRATLHYMSPTSSAATVIPSSSAVYSVDVFVPFTVTNSNPYSQLTNNATWFGQGRVTYRFPQTPTGPNDVGVSENAELLGLSQLYPNPASGNAVLAMLLKQQDAITVNLMNTVGQTVRTFKASGYAGENQMNLDLSGLASGIYLVNINSGNATATKKLIIE